MHAFVMDAPKVEDSTEEDAADGTEEEDEPTAPLSTNIRRLSRFIGPHWKWIVIGTLFATIDAIATTIQSILVGNIVDSFSGIINQSSFDTFKSLLINLSIVYVVEALFSFLVAFCFKTAGMTLPYSPFTIKIQ
jgi:hypothetical protein